MINVKIVLKGLFRLKADAEKVKRMTESAKKKPKRQRLFRLKAENVKNSHIAKFFVFSGKKSKLKYFNFLAWFHLKAVAKSGIFRNSFKIYLFRLFLRVRFQFNFWKCKLERYGV